MGENEGKLAAESANMVKVFQKTKKHVADSTISKVKYNKGE